MRSLRFGISCAAGCAAVLAHSTARDARNVEPSLGMATGWPARPQPVLAAAAPGRVFSWGRGLHGQLGLAAEDNVWVPTQVHALAGDDVAAVAAGGHLSAVVTALGETFTFGCGRDRGLGHGDDENESIPRLVEGLADSKIAGVACGVGHMAAFDAAGKVMVWGSAAAGQLGTGSEKTQPLPVCLASSSLGGHRIVQAACSRKHTILLAETGQPYIAGGKKAGRRLPVRGAAKLTESDFDDLPKPVAGPASRDKIVRVAAGEGHILMLGASGTIYSSGLGDCGQLGTGKTSDVPDLEPQPVRSLRGHKIVDIAAGGSHSLALTDTGRVFSCGSGQFGQLGRGDTANSSMFQEVEAFTDGGIKVAAIACGGNHSAAVTHDGALYVFGKGRDGQLGLGDIGYRTEPEHVTKTAAGPLPRVRAIALGEDHTLAITD